MQKILDNAEVSVVHQVDVHGSEAGRWGQRDEAGWRSINNGADGQAVGLLPPIKFFVENVFYKIDLTLRLDCFF